MFKVGQKVVCINNKFINEFVAPLEVNEIYTISALDYGSPDGELHLKLREVEQASAYASREFRPLDETFAENVLEMMKEQIKEEELQLV